VAALDGDQAGNLATPGALAVADAVVRLPPGHAIEKALVAGLDGEVIRRALVRLGTAFGANVAPDTASATGAALVRLACDVISPLVACTHSSSSFSRRGCLRLWSLDASVAAGLGKAKGRVDL
jgi:hypothetical protein